MLRREPLRSTLRMDVQSVGDRRLFKLFWRTMGYFWYNLKELAQGFACKRTRAAKNGEGGGRRTRTLCFRANFSIVPQMLGSLQSTISYIFIDGHSMNFAGRITT